MPTLAESARRRLSLRQHRLLESIRAQCQIADCTGGCNHGWYEPLEGADLRSARALERRCLIVLANGSRSRWIAAHIVRHDESES
jgi:hypothetical protein